MREFFRTTVETWHGNEAVLYIEFTDRLPSRQVSNVGDRWLTSRSDFDDDIGPLLTEGALEPEEFGEEDRLTEEQFEQLWRKAVAAEDALG